MSGTDSTSVTPASATKAGLEKPYRPAKLRQSITGGEAAAIKISDVYNDFFWELARKFTNSHEEGAAAVKEMQADMQQSSENIARQPTNEEQIIAKIAWRRLIKFLQ